MTLSKQDVKWSVKAKSHCLHPKTLNSSSTKQTLFYLLGPLVKLKPETES